MKKSMLSFACFLFLGLASYGQCTYQITHIEGELDVNGVLVSVSSEGLVDFNSGYCLETLPYFIGYNYTLNSSATGSYTFEFSPPVSMVTLNFSGISHGSYDGGHIEEVQLYVNGSHYAIPAPGTLNSCDPMAVLTPEGNIRACDECAVSGWLGTTIEGSISTLTVRDSVYVGFPAGAIFSLFICDSIATGINDDSALDETGFYPNPMTDFATIQYPNTYDKVTFSLYAPNGECVRRIAHISGGTFTLLREDLPAGLYFYILQSDTRVMDTGKVMIQ